ncbi:MZT2B [Bugula neritina]|uniref:MZT2B n=1 Tax=Bugula neritina TaxID=10212 RepID=A0A7J7IWY9_BUGNE|nr:MZT2B [Bugula neritina]
MMVMESFTLTSSLPFNVEETELYELTELAGVTIDPKVFKIILNLLKLNIQPKAIVEMLKKMCHEAQRHNRSRRQRTTHMK